VSVKANNFHVTLKSLCNFLLVIRSNLGLISHCFWDMVSFRVKCIFPTPAIQTQILKMFHLHWITEILQAPHHHNRLIICVKLFQVRPTV